MSKTFLKVDSKKFDRFTKTLSNQFALGLLCTWRFKNRSKYYQRALNNRVDETLFRKTGHKNNTYCTKFKEGLISNFFIKPKTFFKSPLNLSFFELHFHFLQFLQGCRAQSILTRLTPSQAQKDAGSYQLRLQLPERWG